MDDEETDDEAVKKENGKNSDYETMEEKKADEEDAVQLDDSTRMKTMMDGREALKESLNPFYNDGISWDFGQDIAVPYEDSQSLKELLRVKGGDTTTSRRASVARSSSSVELGDSVAASRPTFRYRELPELLDGHEWLEKSELRSTEPAMLPFGAKFAYAPISQSILADFGEDVLDKTSPTQVDESQALVSKDAIGAKDDDDPWDIKSWIRHTEEEKRKHTEGISAEAKRKSRQWLSVPAGEVTSDLR